MADEEDFKWARAGRPGWLPIEDRAGHDIRVYGDHIELKNKAYAGNSDEDKSFADLYTGSFERTLLFDAVAWSKLSYKLTDNTSLPFDCKAIAPRFLFAAIESKLVKNTDETSKVTTLQYDDEAVLIADADLGAWKPADGKAIHQWCDMFIAQIERAIENGANVICAGEFALPPKSAVLDVEERIKDVLIKAKEPVFIVAGSSHNPSQVKSDSSKILSNENVAKLFAFDPRLDKNQSGEDVKPISHAKKSPALRIGERLFTDSGTELPIYKTPFANFGLLICSDAFDFRILLSYLRGNPGKFGKAQIILVPSYNRSDLLPESCRYLSYLANCAVIYINSGDCDFENKGVRTFVAGFEDCDIADCIDKNRNIFDPKTFGSAEVHNWIKQKETIEIERSFSDGKVDRKSCRDVIFYNINPARIHQFASGAALGAGGLLQTAMEKDREFKL